MTRPFEVGEKMLQVGAYLGIAAAPAAEIAVPDLLRRADIAMDHAGSGRVFVDLVRRRHGARADRPQRDRAEHAFALDYHERFVAFEPQVELTTGRVTSSRFWPAGITRFPAPWARTRSSRLPRTSA